MPLAPLAYCVLHICLLLCLEGVPPCCYVLGDSSFGGSAHMAASHQVLLSPSTYICLGVPLPLEVARGRLPWLPLYLLFAHTCSLPCFAVNWHLPSILNIIDKSTAMIQMFTGGSFIRCECLIFATTTILPCDFLPLNGRNETRNHLVVRFQTFEGLKLSN